MGLPLPTEPCSRMTQTTPCFKCIRNKEYVAFCTWDIKETSIKIPTALWTIEVDDAGNLVAVRDDKHKLWSEKQISTAMKPGGIYSSVLTGKQLKARQQTYAHEKKSLLEGVAVDKAAPQKRKRQKSPEDTTEPPLPQSWFSAPSTEAGQEAMAAFNSLFPAGWEAIPTDGTNLQCAFNAVINSLESMRHQSIEVPVPTLAELQEVYNDVNFFAELRAFEIGNLNVGHSNYRVN